MSHLYGKVQGGRGEVTRTGTKKSGLTTTAASWEGSVQVSVNFNETEGCDWCRVVLAPWQGQGNHVLLYEGPVSGIDAEEYMIR